jgi:hypothetical protein
VDLGLANQLLCRVDRLGRVALGVAGDDLDLAALDATCGIDRFGGVDDATVETDAGRRAWAGERGQPADADRFCLCNRRTGEPERRYADGSRRAECEVTSIDAHVILPIVIVPPVSAGLPGFQPLRWRM